MANEITLFLEGLHCLVKINKHMGFTAFQEYWTYIESIVNQRWAKTGVPGEKPPDLPMQNLASHMCPERGSNHNGERSNV